MVSKKKFKKRTIWTPESYRSYGDVVKDFFQLNNVLKVVIIILCVLAVWYLGKKIILASQVMMWNITEWTVSVISNKLWQDMKTDEFGNVNVLLVGHGWWDHAWWYLADSIIVASWNPNNGAVTFMSVPRDLYVKMPNWNIEWKINMTFARAYNKNKSLDEASALLSKKLSEIVWFEIPYYAIIDFSWFENVIDTIDGVDIHVAQSIYDTEYPDGSWQYTTFYLTAGYQTLDGETALKYARSRHSTSDFSRSARQQEIIKAIMDKMMSDNSIRSVSKVKKLYKDYTEMVHTNIELKEILWMMKYVYDIKHFFSFGLTTECMHTSYELTQPWCFLYVPLRENFGWSSVLLPNGADVNNINNYEYTKNFAFFVTHNQDYLIENPNIIVYNGIDKSYAYKIGKRASWHAWQMAVKLTKYGFNIWGIDNFDGNSEVTKVLISHELDYPETIKTLKYFIDINKIETWHNLTWYDMALVIWNDYLDDLSGVFNYNK